MVEERATGFGVEIGSIEVSHSIGKGILDIKSTTIVKGINSIKCNISEAINLLDHLRLKNSSIRIGHVDIGEVGIRYGDLSGNGRVLGASGIVVDPEHVAVGGVVAHGGLVQSESLGDSPAKSVVVGPTHVHDHEAHARRCSIGVDLRVDVFDGHAR